MKADEVVSLLLAQPETVAAAVMDREAEEEALGEEYTVGTSSGMPLDNQALKAALKKHAFVCLAFREPLRFSDAHTMQMVGEDGKIIGFDIRLEDRHLYEERPDVVWLSDDFPLFTGGDMPLGQATMVMLPQHLACLDGKLPDHVVVVPATTVDRLLRRRYGIERSPRIATAIVCFDEGPA